MVDEELSSLLHAFDAATGNLLWTTQLDGNQAFHDSPPVAYRGIIYVNGIGTGGTVYAYDEGSGALLWSHFTAGGDASPAVSDDGVFIASGCHTVYALDRLTGAPLWMNQGGCEGGASGTPVIAGQTLLVSPDVLGDEMLDVTTGKVTGFFVSDLPPAVGAGLELFVASGSLTAVDAASGSPRWTFAPDGGATTMALVARNVVYVGSSIGTVFALDAASGAVLWFENTGAVLATMESFTTEPRVAFAASDELLVVPAGQQLIAYGPSVAEPGTVDGGTDGGCGVALMPGPPSPPPSGPFLSTSDVALADMNQDGKTDLVIAGAYNAGYVRVLLGHGDATFDELTYVPLAIEANDLGIGDFNGDGKPDVVFTSTYSGETDAGPYAGVMLNRGDGSLDGPVLYTVGDFPGSVTIADVDLDGNLDVLVSTSIGVSVLLGRGDGAFRPATTVVSDESSSLAVGDLDSDGKPDIVAITNAGLNLLFGHGDGTFAQPASIALSRPSGVAIGDVDHDGIPDLAVTDSAQLGEVNVLLGHGNGTFGPPTAFEVGVQPGPIRMSDMNADGRMDLVVGNVDSESVSVLLGNGDGTFQRQLAFGAGGDTLAIAVAGVNGDSLPDVAVIGNSEDGITVLLNRCGR